MEYLKDHFLSTFLKIENRTFLFEFFIIVTIFYVY